MAEQNSDYGPVTELVATVEIKLAVPYGTDLGKVMPGFLAAVLGDLIDIEEIGTEPFAFREITVTHVGLGAQIDSSEADRG